MLLYYELKLRYYDKKSRMNASDEISEIKNIKTYDNSSLMGVMGATDEVVFPGQKFSVANDESDMCGFAQNLYHFLNLADQQNFSKILLELSNIEDSLTATLKVRLTKASKGKMLYI